MNLPHFVPKPRLINSLRWNHVLIGGIGFAGLLLLSLLVAGIGSSILLLSEKQHLVDVTTLTANALESVPENDLQTQVNKFKLNTRYRISLIAMDGRVLADSDANPIYMENHATRPEVMSAANGASGFSTRASSTIHIDMLYYARPWHSIILRIALPLHFVAELQRTLYIIIFSVLAGCFLLMSLISWWLYRGVIRPVNHILEAAAAWEAGLPPPALYISKPQELARIARAMSHMAEELVGRIAESELRERELQELFEAIREPVFVLDHHGLIQVSNGAARRFIAQIADKQSIPDQQTLQGMHLITYIRSSELSNLVENAFKIREPAHSNITLFGLKTLRFNAYVAPLLLPEQQENSLTMLVLYID